MILTSTDKGLINRDRSLKGLATLFDSNLLREQLTRINDSAIDVPTRQYIRYKPGTNCLVSYRGNAETGIPSIYAKAYADKFAVKVAKDSRRIIRGWSLDGRMWALPKQRVLVRQFPLDARLRSLKVLADRDSQSLFVRRLFPNQISVEGTKFETLAYKPERRFVARLIGVDGHELVLKFYKSRAFSRSLANLRYLKSIGFALLPQLVAKSKRHRVLALSWHPGSILREQLVSDAVIDKTTETVAAMLASLHEQTTSSNLATWSVQHEQHRLQALTNTLGILVPKEAKRTQQLCDDIGRQLAMAPSSKRVIHGDFHSKQILVNNGDVRLLDADELAVGPAQLDVGTFVAHLYRDCLSGRVDPSVVSQTVDTFLNAYQAAGGRIDHLNVYTALALLKFSHHPFRACENNWDKRIGRILDLAEQFVCDRNKFKFGRRAS